MSYFCPHCGEEIKELDWTTRGPSWMARVKQDIKATPKQIEQVALEKQKIKEKRAATYRKKRDEKQIKANQNPP